MNAAGGTSGGRTPGRPRGARAARPRGLAVPVRAVLLVVAALVASSWPAAGAAKI